MIEITLLGTGSPIPDPDRAGPSTLVRAGGQVFLVDCGRGCCRRGGRRGGCGRLVGSAAHPPAQRPHCRTRRRAHHQLGHQLRGRSRAPPGHRAARHRGNCRRDAQSVRPRHRLPDRPSRRPERSAAHRGSRIHRQYGLGPRWCSDRSGTHRSPPGGADDRVPRRVRRRVGGAGRGHRALSQPGRIGRRRRCVGAHRDPQGHRHELPQQRVKDICDYHSSVQEAAATAARAGWARWS